MRALSLAILLAAGPAWAVCPAHMAAITATPTGAFRLCASETDQEGDPLPASAYQSCTVNVTWAGGSKTGFVNLTSITPGTPMLVSFPAAKGAGNATGFCTNTDGVTAPGAAGIAASAMTFRLGTPGKPGLSQ